MAFSKALPKTLQSITATKITELSKQQALYLHRKASILKSASEQATLHDKVKVLLEGVTRTKGFPADGLDTSDKDDNITPRETEAALWTRSGHRNIRRFLVQSKYDPSIPKSTLLQWEAELTHELDILSIKHDHALFFSRLVTEWLVDSNGPSTGRDSTIIDGSYEQVGRKEMHEQRAVWETLVFEPFETNPTAIEAYLNKLFTVTKLSDQALKDLRKEVKKFSDELM